MFAPYQIQPSPTNTTEKAYRENPPSESQGYGYKAFRWIKGNFSQILAKVTLCSLVILCLVAPLPIEFKLLGIAFVMALGRSLLQNPSDTSSQIAEVTKTGKKYLLI